MEVSRYDVDIEPGEVQRLHRFDDGFEPEWPAGQPHARVVLLASGATDVDPTVPRCRGPACRFVRYCPVCDGFEVIGQNVGVIADGPGGVREPFISAISPTE